MTSAPAPKNKSFISRELHGASFLTLEHIAHMMLVVIMPGLVLCASIMALSLWFGIGSVGPIPDMSYYYGNTWVTNMGVTGITATLFVLLPLMLILEARTRAEWRKRPAYAGRLAYKAPLYSALAVLTAIIIGFKIQILATILAALASIGLTDSLYMMYASTFVPTILGFVLFSAAWWYVFTLVKGTDYGKTFSVSMALIGIVMGVALFVTMVVTMHSSGTNTSSPIPTYYQDDNGNTYYQ